MTRSLSQSQSLQSPLLLSIESTNIIVVEYQILVADFVVVAILENHVNLDAVADTVAVNAVSDVSIALLLLPT